MRFHERIFGVASTVAVSVGISYATKDPLMGVAFIGASVLALEVVVRPVHYAVTKKYGVQSKVMGHWIGSHDQTGRVCIFEINFDPYEQQLKLCGDVYDARGYPASSWYSKSAFLDESGTRLSYLHVGAYERNGNGAHLDASGYSRLNFENADRIFTRGRGHFFDDLPSGTSSFSLFRSRNSRDVMTTSFERITPELLSSLGLPSGLKLRSQDDRGRLIAAYRLRVNGPPRRPLRPAA